MMVFLGLLLVTTSVFLSNQAWTNFLLGANGKDLSWGITLFRALLIFHGILLIGATCLINSDYSAKSEIGDNAEATISRKAWLIMIVLSLIAIALRLFALNSDLWTDEVFTLLDFARLSYGEILTGFPNQNQHMLFSLLARLSLDVFGESAWALRLPSVVFGIGSLWAMFALGRKLLGESIALLTVALMAFSYHHVWFSQNARGYMGLLFFALLAVWLWFEALKRNKSGWWAAYAAAIALGMWIHMTMIFIVIAQFLIHISFLIYEEFKGTKSQLGLEKRAGIQPFAAWLFSATLTLQFYALSLPEFFSRGLHEESKNSEWTNPLWALAEAVNNLSFGVAGYVIAICGAAFIFFGWLKIFGKNKRAALLMITAPLGAGVFMFFAGHNLFPRFFFFAMGFGLLIAVCGAYELPNALFKLLNKFYLFKNYNAVNCQSFGLICAGLLIIASLLTLPRNYSLPKQDFSGARNYVEQNHLANEKIVAVRIAGEMYGRYFAPQWTNVKTEDDLENIERSQDKIWLIYTLSPEIKAFRPQLWEAIGKNYQIEKIFPGTLNGGEIYVCRKRSKNEVENEYSQYADGGENKFVGK
jgi:mannosyltransferase